MAISPWINLIPGVGQVVYGSSLIADANKKKKCTNKCKAWFSQEGDPRLAACIADCKAKRPPSEKPPHDKAYYTRMFEEDLEYLSNIGVNDGSETGSETTTSSSNPSATNFSNAGSNVGSNITNSNETNSGTLIKIAAVVVGIIATAGISYLIFTKIEKP